MIARKAIAAFVLALGFFAVFVAPAAADFGIASFEVSLTDEAGGPFTQAGGHPYAATTTFTLNTAPGTGVFHGLGPDGNVKDVEVNLPPGLVGNPQALPMCTFQGFAARECPAGTQVGTAAIAIDGVAAVVGVYNMVPREGEPAEFAAYAAFQIVIDFKIRTGADYGITAPLGNLSTGNGVTGSSLTIWGVPADPSHDDQRCESLDSSVTPPACDGATENEQPHPAGVPLRPLLTLPTSCRGPQTWSMRADSWQEPGVFSGAGATVPATTGCDRLDFSPQIAVQPTTGAADSPSGLHFDLRLPEDENPDGTAEANLRSAVVDLPTGMVVDPSAAEGLVACGEAEIGYQGGTNPAQFSPGPAECPAGAKIGSVSIHTPLLDHPLPGAIYLARQTENPFGSLFALYLTAYDPISGVVVKLPGKVELDPVTGRLTASFEEAPQLPFEELEIEFFGGPRATLTTPSTCGTYTTTTDLTPWTSPEGADARPSSSFPINSGADGGACVASEAQMANAPSFEAGTVTPLAGTYSPFVLKVTRKDGSQRIGAIEATLPEGLIGKLAGVSYCSDAAIARAGSRNGLGGGAVEQADPSCPAGSEVGVVNVGAGSGSPTYVRGHAYLAGPYKGAPLSLVVITPAVAGPFDLGSVVIRNALYVDPVTAQIRAVSDPIPQRLAGIPLDIRSIAIDLDRPNFTLNPTDCEPMQVLGATTSTLGQAAALRNRFQVGGCKGLDFAPKLALRVFGKTNRNSKPRFRAVLTTKPGEANIARAQVNLPHSEFLEQSHLHDICTRVQWNAGGGHGEGCPKKSIYGHARAITPLLEKPLQGPVYLRSSAHKLPDLVAALNGQIDVELDGKVDTGPNNGIRNTFEVVPDAPVSKFVLELKGGGKGLLVNSEPLCSEQAKTHATVRFVGQNGKVESFRPKVANSCKKPKRP
jgi:hypothetical protein